MNKPEAIIFDLDGTLADVQHRLHYIQKNTDDSCVNWEAFNSACDKDEPNYDIIELTRMYMEEGYYIIIASGRNESARNKTGKWLIKHHVHYDDLIMRPDGDYRPDEVLKSEMLDTILQHHEVHMCIDDRDKVVEMWRNRGIRCLQVAKGDF